MNSSFVCKNLRQRKRDRVFGSIRIEKEVLLASNVCLGEIAKCVRCDDFGPFEQIRMVTDLAKEISSNRTLGRRTSQCTLRNCITKFISDLALSASP